MTIKDVARLAGVAPRTVRHWLRRKQLRARLQPFGNVRINLADYVLFMQRRLR
jgi:DNA-binding transcriptional MerR regulator